MYCEEEKCAQFQILCIQRVEIKKIGFNFWRHILHYHFFSDVLKASLDFWSDKNIIESVFIFFFWDHREKENSRSVIVNQQVWISTQWFSLSKSFKTLLIFISRPNEGIFCVVNENKTLNYMNNVLHNFAVHIGLHVVAGRSMTVGKVAS